MRCGCFIGYLLEVWMRLWPERAAVRIVAGRIAQERGGKKMK